MERLVRPQSSVVFEAARPLFVQVRADPALADFGVVDGIECPVLYVDFLMFKGAHAIELPWCTDCCC